MAQLEAPVGAQNDEKWQGCEANSILALRKHFGFNINIHPNQFDIMVMANIFGDIISDLACTARLNWASTICIAQILSVSLMLSYSFRLVSEVQDIADAINLILEDNFRSQNIYTQGNKLVSTKEFTDGIYKIFSYFILKKYHVF
ncbi:MAG: isocitrate/isopropylmalate family dehydrogenase [Francisella endosymbiont of Hyalomma asiaticum]